MANQKPIIPPQHNYKQSQIAKVSSPPIDVCLSVSFSKFQLKPVRLDDEFNSHFKDDAHFCAVASNFLGIILPKITSHTYKQLCEGTPDANSVHFHSIDEEHLETVRVVLNEYGYTKTAIDQMFEGNHIFQFSGTLGHTYPARAICHKIDNVLYLLFLDTNHHIYMNEKYTKDSFFYEHCPIYQQEECKYMPYDCFAFEYLDLRKIEESFGYSAAPEGKQ